jgi:phage N-6-adenine-methyltransferase
MPRRRKYRNNAARQRAYRLRKSKSFYRPAKSYLWGTPSRLFAELDRKFHFDLDVCATPDAAKCARFFTPEMDGLKQQWSGTCFCNPPFRGLSKWVKKAYEESLTGATVVCLLPSRTDTGWFHRYVLRHAKVRFLPGRLKFGDAKTSAPFASLIAVFRPPSKKAPQTDK